jgi:hypothetical protein
MFRKLVGLLTVTVSGLFLSSAALAGIATTAHDFSGADLTGSGQTDQICVVCHAPHNNLNDAGKLLWNREAVTSSSYTAYTSSTLDGASSGPDGTSLLCLGCHDGTIAVDNYGTISGGNQPINGSNFAGLAEFTTNLSQDHPIGITYDITGTTGDAELKDPTTSAFGSGTFVSDYLSGGKVQCSTCHDVHATAVVADTPLLIVTNVASAICIACHDK